MANLVNAYKSNRHSRKPVFKSITYVERGDRIGRHIVNETTDDFKYQGQRFNDFDSCQAAIARNVMHLADADTLPEDESPTPDHL